MLFIKDQKFTPLIVNFGGPRNLIEVEEFLIELLTDQEVVRTPFPKFLHRLFFTRVAKKRSKVISHDYALIGGKSPIFEDTEWLAQQLGEDVITFHRYLPKTHQDFLDKIKKVEGPIRVFPLFPQFSYATTGSIALWFKEHLPNEVISRMSWIKSYAEDPAYIDCFTQCIHDFLREKEIPEEKAILLFSAHGLPQRFVDTGDVYERECRQSFEKLSRAFPNAISHLSYQSQFGKEEWIKPYTSQFCKEMEGQGREHVIMVPLSFTSDHIETLFEVEAQYIPLLKERGFNATRCPALNRREDWVRAIAHLLQEGKGSMTQSLLRKG